MISEWGVTPPPFHNKGVTPFFVPLENLCRRSLNKVCSCFKGVSFSLLPFSTSIRDPFWGEILFQSNETERAKGEERDIDFLPFAQVCASTLIFWREATQPTREKPCVQKCIKQAGSDINIFRESTNRGGRRATFRYVIINLLLPLLWVFPSPVQHSHEITLPVENPCPRSLPPCSSPAQLLSLFRRGSGRNL